MAKKYLSLERLTEYDELIKGVLSSGDDTTLASAKSYADGLANGKSDKGHDHDDRYYTETEIDTKLSAVNTSITNITSGTVVVKEAEHATNADTATNATNATNANHATSADTATSATSATKATQDGSGNVITSTYETKTDASAKLAEAKTYTDTHAADTVIHITADERTAWNAVEENAKSYTDEQIVGHEHFWNDIADRPFGEGEARTLVAQYSSQFGNNPPVDIPPYKQYVFELRLEIGKTYVVSWNGVEYTCVCTATSLGHPSIGSIFVYNNSSYNDLGIPFYMYSTGDTCTCYAEVYQQNRFEIYEINETIIPLDPKYLPEEYATAAYVDEQLAGKSDSTHKHDNDYDAKGAASTALDSAKAYTDTVAAGKSDTTHNHDDKYDVKGAADEALRVARAEITVKTANMATTQVVSSQVSLSVNTHNNSTTAHSDIRNLITALSTKVNNFLDVDDTTTDQLSEVLTLINNNKGTLESITSSKVNVSDIVDNLTTADASKVLSANQGVALKALIDALQTAVDGKSDAGHKHTVSEITDLTATAAELNYMDGVTSNVQTQLDAKQATITGGASTIVSSNLTTNRALVSNGSGKVAVSDITSTELGYLDGAKSNIQTQIDAVSGNLSTHTGNADIHFTAAERTKLAGIAEGANKITVDTALSTTSTNPVQNKVVNSALSTASQAITANAQSIETHTTQIANLQTAVNNIQEISSQEIQNLFKA